MSSPGYEACFSTWSGASESPRAAAGSGMGSRVGPIVLRIGECVVRETGTKEKRAVPAIGMAAGTRRRTDEVERALRLRGAVHGDG